MRQIAIGNRSLMDGFGLLGMEVFADPDINEVEQILVNLLRAKEKAMVFLQQDLARQDLPILHRLRNEGGNILISEIPDILSAESYQSSVDQVIKRVLGSNIDLGAGHG